MVVVRDEEWNGLPLAAGKEQLATNKLLLQLVSAVLGNCRLPPSSARRRRTALLSALFLSFLCLLALDDVCVHEHSQRRVRRTRRLSRRREKILDGQAGALSLASRSMRKSSPGRSCFPVGLASHCNPYCKFTIMTDTWTSDPSEPSNTRVSSFDAAFPGTLPVNMLAI